MINQKPLNPCWIILVSAFILLIMSCDKKDQDNQQPQTVTDIDGNVYQTVKIGKQIWMSENLRTTKYSNGDTIGTTDPFNKSIADEINPKYQWVYHGEEKYLLPYGRLYTYYVVTDSRSVCPTGWHVPDFSEYTELEDTLGGSSIAGGKLKESGFDHWLNPNTDGTNLSGFTALPGGYRSHAGGNTISGSQSLGSYGFYWTITPVDNEFAHSRRIMNNVGAIYDHITEKNDGVSIRCLKN